jgi:uncharacterized protein YbjT (DUF2867 family)
MNIIVGASGQVGSHLTERLLDKGIPAIAVVRNQEKIKDESFIVRQADLFNLEQVVNAFNGGTTAFLLTPENPSSNDIIKDTKKIIENYRKAVEEKKIQRIVCLSCIGAHIEGKIGNILMSRLLEKQFDNLNIEKIIIRPSYYFSNWLGYLSTIEQYGVLPTFFPEDLKVEMHSPLDLADFIADVIAKPLGQPKTIVYELVGPTKYSSFDIAKIFSTIFNKDVSIQSITCDKWKETLLSVGFTNNTADNLCDMTQAVVDGLTSPEYPNSTIHLKTDFESYMKQLLGK